MDGAAVRHWSTSWRALREPVAGLTHLAGAGLGVPVLILLTREAIRVGNLRYVVGFVVFGTSIIALYTASALYHLLPLSPRGIACLRQLDHAMIYVLIAGTYTPFCLVALTGGWRWGMLMAAWGLALGGIGQRLRWPHAPVWLSTPLYITLGWLATPAVPVLGRTLQPSGLAWLVAGGLVYTLGAIIYMIERPVLWKGAFGSHELWHLFVLAGSACHVWVVAHYLVAPG